MLLMCALFFIIYRLKKKKKKTPMLYISYIVTLQHYVLGLSQLNTLYNASI